MSKLSPSSSEKLFLFRLLEICFVTCFLAKKVILGLLFSEFFFKWPFVQGQGPSWNDHLLFSWLLSKNCWSGAMIFSNTARLPTFFSSSWDSRLSFWWLFVLFFIVTYKKLYFEFLRNRLQCYRFDL